MEYTFKRTVVFIDQKMGINNIRTHMVSNDLPRAYCEHQGFGNLSINKKLLQAGITEVVDGLKRFSSLAVIFDICNIDDIETLIKSLDSNYKNITIKFFADIGDGARFISKEEWHDYIVSSA